MKIVGAGTDVVAAVKLSVGAPAAGAPAEGRVSVLVECGPSVVAHLSAQKGFAAAEALNAELTAALGRTVNCAGALDLRPSAGWALLSETTH